MNKLKSLKNLKKIVSKLKKIGKYIVFTNGCFDLLHPGHIKILKEAKKRGDILILGLNSDYSIRKLKGVNRPILNQNARAEILSAIQYVDYIVFFNELTPLRLVKEIKPHYLVKGSDWKKNEIIGKEFVQKVFRVKLYPNYSTSKIIKKILKNHGQTLPSN